MNTDKYFYAFTDGSCRGNGKENSRGGWGWVAYEKRENYKVQLKFSNYGGNESTTNQRMELQGMIEFLEFCPENSVVDIYSDSMYVLGGIIGKLIRKSENETLIEAIEPNSKGWLNGWIDNNFVKKTSLDKYSENMWIKIPKNEYEWYRIYKALLHHKNKKSTLKFGWVKGHTKDMIGNIEADRLSNKYYEKIKK